MEDPYGNTVGLCMTGREITCIITAHDCRSVLHGKGLRLGFAIALLPQGFFRSSRVGGLGNLVSSLKISAWEGPGPI